MHAQDTAIPPAPAWLNLYVVVDEPTCAELRQLGDRIALAIEDLAPVLEQCYRALRRVGEEVRRAAPGNEAWDLIHKHAGAERLSDLLYLLGANAEAAVGERVDHVNVPWLAKVQAELGLDEWNVPVVAPAQQ